MITIDDFKKIDIAVGQIVSAEKVENSKKLLKLVVDLGEEKHRQIISGIAKYFPDESKLVGKKCMFVANLEPRMINGFESQGMILAVSTDENIPDAIEGKFSLLSPSDDIPPGTRAR